MNNSIFTRLIGLFSSQSEETSIPPEITQEEKPVATLISPKAVGEAREVYETAVNLLKTSVAEEGWVMMHGDFGSKNVKLALHARDWMELYNTISESNSSKSFNFDMDETTLMECTNEEVRSFIYVALGRLNIKNNTEVKKFDKRGVAYFIDRALNEGMIEAKPKEGEHGPDKKINLDEILEMVQEILEINEQKKRDNQNHFATVVQEVKNFILDLAKEELSKKMVAIHEKINKTRNPFNSLDEGLSVASGNLLASMIEIEKRASGLELELSEKVMAIGLKAREIIEQGLGQLSIDEKIKFTNTIEKDLPSLIFNYLNMPQSMRENLVDKQSNLNLKDLLKQSFSSIDEEFKSMGKLDLAHARSLHEIQATAKYLKARQ